MKCTHNFVRKSGRNRLFFVKEVRGGEHNINLDVEEIRYEAVDWIYVAQERETLLGVLYHGKGTVGFIKRMGMVDELRDLASEGLCSKEVVI